MQHVSVEKLFKEQIKHYSKKGQYEKSPLSQLVLKRLHSKEFRKTVTICEFGGGAGELLNEIQKIFPKVILTNVEIVNDYKRYLVSKKIKFILGSVLNSKFKNNSFDLIIMRDVLHHLVGRNYKETLQNQTLALKELKRLVRPGGVIFIEELINESEIAARIIYYLSWFNTKIGVHIPSLFISKNVIVAYLSSNKLLNVCDQVFGRKNIEKQELGVEVKWYFTLLHFLGGLKKITITINK